MSCFDQEQYDIRCEWGLPGVEQIASSDVIVIVDVLSFSTSVEVAVGRGVTVFPYRWKDDTAKAYAQQRSAELAGSRNNESGKYSLAPSSLIRAHRGLRLVLPSPNGSALSFEAMSHGAVVFAGSLRNATAVASEAQAVGQRITVIPAGERWPDGSLRPAIEDLIGAGAIIKQLKGTRSPESSVAVAAFEEAAAQLQNRLFSCSSGRELIARGFVDDVEIAAELNVSRVVPKLVDQAFVAELR
ncbi:2-phosphosulfolactate phosphatase [Gimesia fumaroli]|uniref:Probable 2-phosphosulfolactate phosphatase n=1 Tax=Gimesia fumaroli TaxID=2527976 RepID=A0A518IB25_9PLAN|nr:2-phosphosulfolactate phosphatase [Gimesia fumaroli]QDV50306.1 putative 2-phosphosulfolactate phosphatase [Gimesia fumaroli]